MTSGILYFGVGMVIAIKSIKQVILCLFLLRGHRVVVCSRFATRMQCWYDGEAQVVRVKHGLCWWPALMRSMSTCNGRLGGPSRLNNSNAPPCCALWACPILKMGMAVLLCIPYAVWSLCPIYHGMC